MRKLPPLNSLRAFEAAARHESFTAAANELCVTVTAVSHQVRQLEELIGRKLFERSGRAVALTTAGGEIYPLLRDGFDKLATAFSHVASASESDRISVSMTRAFAERWLMPRLERFACAFPNVTVNIHASEDVIDLRAEGIDLAVRYGPPHGGIGQTVLLEDHYIAVAASAICGSGAVQIDQFRNKPLLAYKWKNPAFSCPTWTSWIVEAPYSHDGDYKISWFSEETLAMHAAERGLGPLLSSNVLIDEGIKSGTMRRIEGPTMPGYAYRIVELATTARKKSVRQFVEWLRQEASDFASEATSRPMAA